MSVLEQILQEIEEKKEKALNIVKIEVGPMEITIHREQYKGLRMAEEIIRKHLNDGWIPVEERLPTEKERNNPERKCMKRLEVAYMTDIVEYTHGYFDGYKWIDKRLRTIKNVVAWKPHAPYNPKEEEK